MKIFLFLSFLLTLSSLLFSNHHVLHIDEVEPKYDIRKYAYSYYDVNNNLNIDSLSNKDFIKDNTNLNFGMSYIPVWVKFSVINKSDSTLNYVLQISNPDINVIDFYQLQDGEIINEIFTGESQLFDSRDIDHRNYCFDLSIKPNVRYDFYIKSFNNGDALFLPITFKEYKTFSQEDSYEVLINSVVFGLYLFIIIFNIFLFVTIKDRVYLYYFLCVVFFGMSLFGLEGLSFQLFWGNSPKWSNMSTILFLALAFTFYIIFSKIFLETKKSNRIIDKGLHVVLILLIITSLISFFGYPLLLYSVYSFIGLVPFITIFITAACISAIRRNDIPAYYYLVTVISFAIFAVLHIMKDTGVLPYNIITGNALKLGLMIDNLILTLAVVDRFRRTQNENQRKLEEQKMEIHMANEELTVAKEYAEEADRIKSAFLANMSHEIRTPLNSIMGFSSLLLHKDVSSNERVEYLNYIDSSSRNMLNIVSDILDIAKIEAKKLNITYSLCNLNHLLEELLVVFKGEAIRNGKENVDVKLNIDIEEIVTISTDSNRLKQVLVNLLTNAVKFTSEGSIEFGVKLVKDNMLEFYVRDTGMGIPTNKVGVVFDRFRQVNESYTREVGGAGLGLTISKTIIELLGGRIWVESEFGKGSVFSFTLPYNPTDEVIEEKKESISYNWAEKKILLTEDNERSFILFREIFKETEVELIRSKNGEEAVALAKSSNPDIILMDINMPIMNGYDATKLIREFNPDITIIAQTAYAIAGEKDKSLDAGFTDFISKPFDSDDLLALVDKYI